MRSKTSSYKTRPLTHLIFNSYMTEASRYRADTESGKVGTIRDFIMAKIRVFSKYYFSEELFYGMRLVLICTSAIAGLTTVDESH